MEATNFYLEPLSRFDCDGRGSSDGGPGHPIIATAGAGHASQGGHGGWKNYSFFVLIFNCGNQSLKSVKIGNKSLKSVNRVNESLKSVNSGNKSLMK